MFYITQRNPLSKRLMCKKSINKLNFYGFSYSRKMSSYLWWFIYYFLCLVTFIIVTLFFSLFLSKPWQTFLSCMLSIKARIFGCAQVNYKWQSFLSSPASGPASVLKKLYGKLFLSILWPVSELLFCRTVAS